STTTSRGSACRRPGSIRCSPGRTRTRRPCGDGCRSSRAARWTSPRRSSASWTRRSARPARSGHRSTYDAARATGGEPVVTLHEAVAGKKLVPPPEPLPEPVIDAHTHLDECGADTAEEVAAAMQRAASVGVAAVVTVGGDMPSNRWSVTAAGARDDLFAAVAVHPTEALTLTDAARRELESLAAHPAVVAIGETGLDFYWDSAPREAQAEAFAWHIDLAKRVGKPLMIH